MKLTENIFRLKYADLCRNFKQRRSTNRQNDFCSIDGSSFIDNYFNFSFFLFFFFLLSLPFLSSYCSSRLNTLQHSVFFPRPRSSIVVLLFCFISLHVLTKKKKKLREGICRVASFSTRPPLHFKWSYTTRRKKKKELRIQRSISLTFFSSHQWSIACTYERDRERELLFRGQIVWNEERMLSQLYWIIFVWSLIFLRNHNCNFFLLWLKRWIRFFSSFACRKTCERISFFI